MLALSIPHLETRINIDGNLDDAAWVNATTIHLDKITHPYENTPSPVETRVSYFEDGETLYVSFVAEDPEPENIRAFFHGRDNAKNDDLVGIRLDPYGDHRLVFQFYVNPLGVQNDSTYDVTLQSEKSSWDGIWDSAGKVTEKGFQVELAIPLHNFNFNSNIGQQQWAVEFIRFYPREERLRLSHISIDRNNDCWECQMDFLHGFDRLSESNNNATLSLIPTLVVSNTDSRNVYTNSDWNTETNSQVGLDIKWNWSSDLFINATINPDFSQIEADAAQLGFNDNFSLEVEEKRSFFLENDDIFSSQFDLVHTRNISSPNLGIKVTGRKDKHAYGFFAIDDEYTTIPIPGNLGSDYITLNKSSKNTALRYRYDANKDFYIGILGTIRTSEDYHNYVVSSDMHYRITEQDLLQIQLIQTRTNYSEAISELFCTGDNCAEQTLRNVKCQLSNCNIDEQYLRTYMQEEITGEAYKIIYNHDERDWYTYSRIQDISGGFRADLGFQTRVDQNRALFGGGLKYYGNSDQWWSILDIWIDYDILRNDARDVLERELEVHFEVYGEAQSYLTMGYIHRNEVGKRLDPSILDVAGNTDMFQVDYIEIEANIQPVSGLYLELLADFGNRIDFTNNRPAKQFTATPTIIYNINRHANLELMYHYFYLEADDEEVSSAHVADMRLSYNFDTRNSLKFNVIYTDVRYNLNNQPALLPENYPDEKWSDISTQLIYSYKINPQTVIYAGYSDHAVKYDQLNNYEKDDKSLFIKFSYAWIN
ncbi:carbohydrate binding family 9 domain-containing protein [Paraneptunicella aestuarii]|uniref:carbohydrate binding family 9 domain-containing protein n=1 Tax=Paraneptunicella aestuarii TaxID=2831148 RepID=UPI001E5FE68B|nr:carbohydrate binding family 9 domain-containing protein [Paraneptunicella aestuarii]UAA40506.1 carbohydrate binding family 9 domain-containing protein [Paraneptunicella aestuarii]